MTENSEADPTTSTGVIEQIFSCDIGWRPWTPATIDRALLTEANLRSLRHWGNSAAMVRMPNGTVELIEF